MKQLLQAILDYLAYADLYDRKRDTKSKQKRDQKRALLNSVILRYQRQVTEAEKVVEA